MKISQTRLIIGCLIIGLALLAALAPFIFPKPKLTAQSVDEVYAEGVQNPNFVQVSVYGIESLKDGRLRGNGHVRYNRNNMITGYGDGPFGAHITVIFKDTSSSLYKSCAEIMSQPMPFKKELFISGNGFAGTNGRANPLTGVVGSPNIVTFNDLNVCALNNQQ